jgi:flavin reductase (DIM6/NTAB) family NADH-FMN oxidoreductase RutF
MYETSGGRLLRVTVDRNVETEMNEHATALEFRRTAGLFATGITVMSAQGPSLVHGMTANAFASVSLDPLLVLVSVHRDARIRAAVRDAGGYALSLLAADQAEVAGWFGDAGRPGGSAQFDFVAWRRGPTTGAPLIEGALGWIECRLHDTVAAGDHVLMIGRVTSLEASERRDPLVFFGGASRALRAA